MIQDQSTKNEKNTRSYKKLYRSIVEVSGTSKEGILFRQSPKNFKSIEGKTGIEKNVSPSNMIIN